ncbi:helix-turn-helix domain-containing protein [Streptomyces uncialis]|nr:helix-turn-helix transcriptional regulator [Streptomyces uncialis]MCX4660117.1 helix-turn-helix domain-containing protein [Streptomyces uncialis]
MSAMPDETDGTEHEEGTSGAALPRRGGTPQAEPEWSDSLRTFGAVVQALREHAGLSRAEFGLRVGYSKHTIASVKQGRRMPDVALIEAAEALTGETGALRSAALHLSREKGLAAWFRQWAQLEAKALTLWTYECRLIPGLLQSEPYARTLFVNQLPPLEDEQIEAQLTVRLDRQRLLRERPNTAYSFIIEEHLLLRNMGGQDVTRGQLDRLIEVAELRNVEIQVMTLERHSHAGLHGPMRVLETPENKWFGYIEGQESGQLVSDRKVVSILKMRYARMRSQALTLDDSLGLLKRMRGAI